MNSLTKTIPKPLSGMPEMKPEEQMILEDIFGSIKTAFELHGFVPLDTHLMESMDILEAKKGDNILYSTAKSGRGIKASNEIRQIESSNEKQQLGLRFDLTVPATRYVVENFSDLTFPFRRYQIGKVYRGEHPQSNRFNEFYQADIDIFGNGTLPISADVEVLSTMNTILSDLDIGGYKIHLFNRRIWNGFLRTLGIDTDLTGQILSIADNFPKVGKQKTIEQLNILVGADTTGKIIGLIEQKGIESILSYLGSIDDSEVSQGLDELTAVYNKALHSGVSEKNLIVDAATIRGLTYYTGSVYETYLDGEESAGSICSGGRFDNLAENFTTKTIPGVGMSIGVTRLFKKLLDLGGRYDLSVKTPSKVLITRLQQEYEEEYLSILKNLRQSGIPSELYLNENTRIGKQLDYANDKGIPYSIIAGGDEFPKKEVQLKHMYTGFKEPIAIENITTRVKELIAQPIK